MSIRTVGLFLSLTILAGAAIAQVDPALAGRWIAASKESMEISAGVLRYRSLACDEGRCQLRNASACKWSALGDQLKESMGGGTCQFSASSRSGSRESLLQDFDARRKQETNNDKAFLAHIKRSRAALESMKPGPSRTLILNDAGDVFEFHFDGERMFRTSPLGFGVEVFSRAR